MLDYVIICILVTVTNNGIQEVKNKTMRAQIYPDGVKRINAKIEIPMTHVDVAEYVLSAIVTEQVNLDQVQKLNKRELLRVAKGEIYTQGVEAPKHHITKVDNETDIIVRNYVKNMFPELM
jgi:hypothetical protein